MANFNENAERAVEQTMNQTRGAMEQYFDFVQKAFSSYPLGNTELTEKMKSFTEANIAEAQKFVQSLGQAKDFQDALRIQTEYMQKQFQAFGEQTKSLTESFTKATTGVVKNPFRNY
ncbi:MAG: phasin family protein [Xanthobacteraceae bacterium]